jgi:hypothetical protein
MSTEVQVILGYVGVVGAIGLYAWSVLRNGRRMSAGIRDEDKPWT